MVPGVRLMVMALPLGLVACTPPPPPPLEVAAGFACIDEAEARGDITQEEERFAALLPGEDIEATTARIARRFELDGPATERMRACIAARVAEAEAAAAPEVPVDETESAADGEEADDTANAE